MNALRKINLIDDFGTEFLIIGISCHLKDYRLVYLMNKNLGLDLQKQNDLIIYQFKGKQQNQFSLYHYSRNPVEYNLLANRNPQGILLQEHKHFDYVLLINGHINSEQKRSLISGLTGISNILAAIEIKNDTIKYLDLIISDLELHLVEISKNKKSLK